MLCEVCFGDEAERTVGFADGDFDFEPFLEAVVVFPDFDHAGAGISCDHIFL